MDYFAIRSLGLFLILQLFPYCAICDPDSFLNPYHEVHITNELPSNTQKLTIRCQSKEKDLGYHVLLVGQDYYWGFHRNLTGSTLYFCHFWWNKKDKVITVYDRYSDGRHSFWTVKADGFYFSTRKADDPYLRFEW